MLKHYTTADNIEFKTLTIPKGTALFRGLNVTDRSIFVDFFGDKKDGDFKIAPTANVFFYPAPYVSNSVNSYPIHAIYLTNHPLELLLMIKPSTLNRSIRHSDSFKYIKTCSSISEKDDCQFIMSDADPCFTSTFLYDFPHIHGYIAIAQTDAGRFLMMYKAFLQTNQLIPLLHLFTSIASNERGQQGIPEIVLHPHYMRQKQCIVFKDRLYNNDHNKKKIDYMIRQRAIYSYFPLLYITRQRIYTFNELQYPSIIAQLTAQVEQPGLIDRPLFKNMKRIMNKLLGPAGYTIEHIPYFLTIDLRTGFYLAKTNYTSLRRNHTHRNKTHTFKINDIQLDDDDAIPYSIPITYPLKDKLQIMKIIGTSGFEEERLRALAQAGYSLQTEYVLEKPQNYKKKFRVNHALFRPDVDKQYNRTRKNISHSLNIYREYVYNNTTHMPNECINRITITTSQLRDLDGMIETILAPSGGSQAANVLQRGPRGVRLHMVSAWKPDYLWLQSLIDMFPSCWIKDEWLVEDGKAGVWIGYNKDGVKRISSTEWEDLSLEAENYFFNS